MKTMTGATNPESDEMGRAAEPGGLERFQTVRPAYLIGQDAMRNEGGPSLFTPSSNALARRLRNR
jgi:hypothetical protein